MIYRLKMAFFICTGMYLMLIPVSCTMTSTMPSFPLTNGTIGFFTAEDSGGYPVYPHPFINFTDIGYIRYGQHKNQTLRIFSYYNPPIFPNETVYGILHEELGYVSWVKEYRDPRTGLSSLCQVADTGERGEKPFMQNVSPAENDYRGFIEWFNVSGKIYPRTWIKGSMQVGQSWSEMWGPFPADTNGSVFRKRDAVVSKERIPIAGNLTEVYAVTITGPSELYPGNIAKEVLYFADGVGAVGRDVFEMTGKPIKLHEIEGMPADAPEILPAGELVYTHSVRCTNLSTSTPA
jgi:hypothetical protein